MTEQYTSEQIARLSMRVFVSTLAIALYVLASAHAALPESGNSTIHRWAVAKGIDAMTDSRICGISFQAVARKGINIAMTDGSPVVHWNSGDLPYLSASGETYPGTGIQYRVDKLPAHSSDVAVFASTEATEILQQMLHGQELLVRSTKWPAGYAKDVKASLVGFRAAFEECETWISGK